MADRRPTRAERLLALLISRKGRRVSLPEVQRVAGAQHGARLTELRNLGYCIVNELEHIHGETHSFYTLRATPGETPPLFPMPAPRPLDEDLSRDQVARMGRRG